MADAMRAVAIGADHTVSVEQTGKPVPAAGEVLIAVAYAGLNRADLLQRRGFYPPPPGASPIMGLEVSGTVAAVGAGVSRWKAGDQVCALLAGGGYAEYVAAPEGSVLSLPAGISLEQAGALMEATFTVFANVFEAGGLKPDETLLIHGGASGIGTTGIQMARAHGAKVFATAGDEAKCALVAQLGARAINYRAEDFEAIVKAEGGADVILDMVGGPYVQKNINLANRGGRIVNIAYVEGAKAEVNFMPVMLKSLIITGSTLRARAIAEKARLAREVEARVWSWIEAGKVKPVIDSVFALEDVDAAHTRMAVSKHAGKILLKM
ncbi:MAG TPA: NAD(P)H-quinone oxidoreductase [Caulobacterales bacterium]|jgi:putative PIG3 family NAD(P)H quinone oxidoreductase|nr:NAD(P)H-quinone oxidoreductase [Caulobacterales bacterium]